MQKRIIAIASLLLPYYVMASAQDNGIGVSGSWTQSPYVGKSTDFSLMPLINYDSKYLFISGTSGGVHVWQDGNQQVDITLDYQSLGLKPSDSDDVRVKQLDRRKSTLLSGVAYTLTTAYGQFSGEVAADVLDNSNTVSVDLEYAAYAQLTNKLAIIPQLGVTWFNSSHNRYYYGVSEQESLRSGLSTYRPHSGVTPYATLTATYDFTSKWSAVFEYDFILLGNQVKSSPIVNRSNTSEITAGIMYAF
ncbi:outer membrane protein [Orbus hercynius]|uniref:Outer membrane protein n=1 Tax=Orbus hercynius TaxID=593135 RepID=A0A495RJI0_9GAMM|nr:MipA/OmpV family protein [Orbus hercynius]RKS87605.1 outer membrane protein [Orbus hercynius]